MTTSKPPICPYCGNIAKKTTGREVYPDIAKLRKRTFYLCENDHPPAWVGCHRNTDKPLGTPADAQTRRARQEVHMLFDPLWQGQGTVRRRAEYKWLAQELGIRKHLCHIGMFDLAQCTRVKEILRNRQKSALDSAYKQLMEPTQ